MKIDVSEGDRGNVRQNRVARNRLAGVFEPFEHLRIEQTIADVNVRAHTFKFITPAQSDAMKIPNACNLRHTDKTNSRATESLKSWGDRSPWRAAQR